MIQIPEPTANALLEFYDKVVRLDAQAHENAAMFRKHFMLLARQPPLCAAVSQLRKAMDSPAEKPARKRTTKSDD